MRIPVLKEHITARDNIQEFSGLCRRLRISPSQWQSQRNMSSSAYPAAGVRAHRSLQTQNAPNTISQAVSDVSQGISEESAFTAYGALGAEYVSGDLYILKSVKNSQNQPLGCAFIKNGENQSYTEDITPKLAYFTEEKHHTVRMGSYICVYPEGLVYESENTNEALPLFRTAHQKTLDNFLLSTVYKSSDGSYINLLDYSDGFRVEKDGVYEYLEDSAMWVSAQTYLKLSVLSSASAFSGFKQNDSVSISTVGSPGMQGSIGGSVVFKRDSTYDNAASFKILEIGSESVNGFERDFIIINGYINYEAASKAYLNASDFEIRYDLFPKYQSDVGFELTLKRKMPEVSFACESQNRIWACGKNGHEIYASALGNPYNFYDYSGISTDSYALNVGTNGEFTACVNYLGRPLFFKENALHIISGSYPTNGGEPDSLSFSVSTLTEFRGVERGSENSLAIIDNILYYKSACGIVAFDGANTAVVSGDLGDERFKNAVAGAYNGKYYVSMQGADGYYHLFVYDTARGEWFREDETQVLKFFSVNSELLYINAQDSAVYSVSDSDALGSEDFAPEGDFDWECETGNFGYAYPDSKYISRILLRLKLEQGARVSVFAQYDSGKNLIKAGEIATSGIKTHLLPIVPVRCDHMRIILKGRGDVKILSISKLLEEGGDVQ